AVSGFTPACDAAEKNGSLPWLEIPNRRARKKNHRPSRLSRRSRQGERPVVIGAHGKDFEGKIIAVEGSGSGKQMHPRYVNGHIRDRSLQMIQQESRLTAAGAAGLY